MVSALALSLKKWRHTIGLGILLLLATASLSVGLYNALIGPEASFDFQWPSARAIYLGYSPYHIDALPKEIQTHILTTRTVNLHAGDINFPSSISLLLPYAILDWTHAKLLWAISNLLFAGLAVSILFHFSRPLPQRLKWTVGLLFFASTPLRVVLGNGQHSLLALAFTLLGCATMINFPILSGFFLAVALFKYHLVAPLMILFLIRQKFAPLGIALGIHLIISIWISKVVNIGPIQLTTQCIASAKGLQNAGWIDLPSLLGSQLPLSVIYALVATITATIAYLMWVHRRTISTLEFLSITSVLSVLAVYHRIYDFVLLICPLIGGLNSKFAMPKNTQNAHWIISGWIIAIWFLEKPLTFLGKGDALPFRYLLATWGWIALYLLIKQAIKKESPQD